MLVRGATSSASLLLFPPPSLPAFSYFLSHLPGQHRDEKDCVIVSMVVLTFTVLTFPSNPLSLREGQRLRKRAFFLKPSLTLSGDDEDEMIPI